MKEEEGKEEGKGEEEEEEEEKAAKGEEEEDIQEIEEYKPEHRFCFRRRKLHQTEPEK
jgi:hypothetical protein